MKTAINFIFNFIKVISFLLIKLILFFCLLNSAQNVILFSPHIYLIFPRKLNNLEVYLSSSGGSKLKDGCTQTEPEPEPNQTTAKLHTPNQTSQHNEYKQVRIRIIIHEILACLLRILTLNVPVIHGVKISFY